MYIERTKTLRSSPKLFVSTVKPHGPVSKDTISRWVKASLMIAGIDKALFPMMIEDNSDQTSNLVSYCLIFKLWVSCIQRVIQVRVT